MALIAKDISKIYNQKIVLDNVSLQIEQGQIVGLLGPNGAGKTTCFYIITGLTTLNSGTILLDNEIITNLPLYKRALKGISYLPQEPSIFRKLTVKENLMLIIENLSMSKNEKFILLNSILKQFKIEHLANNIAYSLSGGERRRVEIARALIIKPKYIMLDEPFAGIDPISIKDLKNLILTLKKMNIGILITDHNVRETLKIVDYAYIIREGKVKVEGTSNDIVNNEEAKKYYLGSDFTL